MCQIVVLIHVNVPYPHTWFLAINQVCGYTLSMQLADIKKLALLARIQVPDEELEAVAKDMDSILGYIDQIQKVSVDSERTIPILINRVREDEVTTENGSYTETLLSQAPGRDGNFVKVKKIL